MDKKFIHRDIGNDSLAKTRESVASFSIEMERKLVKCDHKADWRKDDSFNDQYYFGRLLEEAEELSAELCGMEADLEWETKRLGRVMDEAVDVANFAMIIWDRARKGLK